MAVSAHEKPSASYLYFRPPTQSARRVKVANVTVGLPQIVWRWEEFAHTSVLGSCSGYIYV